MPFRLNKQLLNAESLEQQERAGEPFPAHFSEFLKIMKIKSNGEGRSRGSFTEGFRNEFFEWLKAQSGQEWYQSSVTFEYRLYRHKRVLVVLLAPTLWHNPLRGNGKKGFELRGNVESFDGQKPLRGKAYAVFALDRIVPHNNFPLLSAGVR